MHSIFVMPNGIGMKRMVIIMIGEALKPKKGEEQLESQRCI